MADDTRLPHEILLAIARGEAVGDHTPTLAERMTAAKIAAPFYAPRLASVVHEAVGSGQVAQRVEIVIVNPEEPSGPAGAADRTCL
ncbi:hypothetical protein D3273_22805 [Lichenibacterium minor]|uniref:Uncharacterized protein n=1 Tax=Lichenibacterium minor TaxID=2316528 RepID=A0A4Q2U4D6_9HYPH|nr:hypothetical protein [Lichenibacterium minor]RYC29645.1 hypothetical protein D3273_22805 [Lichenibacterium minor]